MAAVRRRWHRDEEGGRGKLLRVEDLGTRLLRSPLFPSLLLLLLAVSCLPAIASAQNSPCPLNFTILQKYVDAYRANGTGDSPRCQFTLQGIHLSMAEYLRTSGRFLPPLNSSASCWTALQPFLDQIFTGFEPRSACGFRTEWISTGCMNISSRSQFESLAAASSPSVQADVNRSCSGSLSGSTCATCTATLSRLNAFLTGPANGNVSECTTYPFIYVAGAVNSFGPANDDTALCAFALSVNPDSILPSPASAGGHRGSRAWLYGVVGGILFLLALAGLGFWCLFRKRRLRRERKKKKNKIVGAEVSQAAIQLESVGDSTSLLCFSIDEIKAATGNFSRSNIIGKGGYGNVYKGVLPDGTKVALKRFKNCSATGDEEFRHEVAVIASVRHVNLVGLRGYCIATTPLEGHQRIIVCDLMQNGSLYDHLFGWGAEVREKKLSWPVRQKIAVGTARGISYLHNGVHPSIIHRDIKASNILLDDDFEPKVADFGLAKFAPEGVSHVSTRVAGTLGYVAPEYALYGQLTERSDVYGFGVLLLELLSGRKAIVSSDGEEQISLIADWAWSLVREGRTLDVIEEGMAEMASSEVMEKYVMVAVLASHPQMYARPLMDKIVKILETDLVVPAIPDRPIPLTSNLDDIEKSIGSSGRGSGHHSSSSGYQMFSSAREDQQNIT